MLFLRISNLCWSFNTLDDTRFSRVPSIFSGLPSPLLMFNQSQVLEALTDLQGFDFAAVDFGMDILGHIPFLVLAI